MKLDTPTMFVMGAGFLTVTALTLALLVRTLPKDVRRSARTGAIATALLALSWMLYALGGTIPEVVSLVGANGLYLLAIALVYQSIRLLDGDAAKPSLYLFTVVPALILILVARYVVDSYSVRVVVMSLGVSLLLALCAKRLFTAPGRVGANGRRPAAYWMAIGAGVLVVRVILTIVTGGAPPLMSGELAPSLAVAVSVVLALGAAFAYFLIFNGRLTAELALQAHLDPLTELLNRRGFEERAQQELRRAARIGAPVSLLMIDANEFKAINDKWGHQAGDVALQAIADGLRAKVRPYDLLARMGGDEFVVLLPGVDEGSLREMIPRLKESIASQPTGYPIKLDVGIGRATLTNAADHGGTGLGGALAQVHALVAKADKDMYSVKNTRF